VLGALVPGGAERRIEEATATGCFC